MSNQFLNKGYLLPDGSKIGPILFDGEKYQIFKTSYKQIALIVKSELLEHWVKEGLIETEIFKDFLIEGQNYHILTSNQDYTIMSLLQPEYPNSYNELLSFASTLRETRKINLVTSLHDALYIEQFSRLLPTYTLSERIEDEVILGQIISGGVNVSVNSFRRLCSVASWLTRNELQRIIISSGLEIENYSEIATDKYKKPSEKETNKSNNDLKIFKDKERFRLPGRPELESFFNDNIIDIIRNEERYQAMGISFPAAIVLHGPPGCGKTFAVERLVEFLGWPNYSMDSSTIASAYIHDTSKKISEIFDLAIENSPSVLVIDEMEAYLSDRSLGSYSGVFHIEEVAEFLRRIPEAIEKKVLILAMTNMIEMIDPAIIRRGRFDHVIKIDMPTRKEVESLVLSIAAKLPFEENINFQRTIDTLVGKPLSDATFLFREAGRLSAKQDIDWISQDNIDKVLANFSEVDNDENTIIGF